MTHTFFVCVAPLLLVVVLFSCSNGPTAQPSHRDRQSSRDAYAFRDDLGNRWRSSWRGFVDDPSWNERDHRREWTVSD